MPTPSHKGGFCSYDLKHLPWVLGYLLVFAVFSIPQTARAQKTWHASVGADTRDHAAQADAFLPNEVWINAGDSIEWAWQPKFEPHTVTLLAPGQTRPTPPPPVGPPVGPPFVFSAICGTAYAGGSTATYDASNCVSSGIVTGSSPSPKFTVTFPNPGNYKLVCLIHTNMNGTVHVLPKAAPLPYLQWDYDRQARDEAEDILKDADNPREEVRDFRPSVHEVLMTGEMVATGGGRQYLALVRYFPETIYIHKGDTVEFTNVDPTEPHTVTSGKTDSLTNDMALVNVSQSADGALAGTVNSPSDFGDSTPTTGLNTGFLQAAPEDAAGRAQSAVFVAGAAQSGLTRVRITFNVAGTFYYHCALHDVDGMNGSVVVK